MTFLLGISGASSTVKTSKLCSNELVYLLDQIFILLKINRQFIVNTKKAS